MNLPAELESYLKEKKKLEYDFSKCECGEIDLLSFKDLKEGTISVDLSE